MDRTTTILNADLHCHSNVSDGMLAPRDVAARAKQNGVDLWALTDHDEIGGIAEARDAAGELALPFITGVEISVTWAGHTIHIVGLDFDDKNENLNRALHNNRNGRDKRARDMSNQLARIGITGAYQGALERAGNPDLISRTHFARYIVEEGYCASISEVFKNYLTEGLPGYIPHRWAALNDAVRWITDAGGVAVVAHPGRYKLDHLHRSIFLDEFRQAGGRGIEVHTGSHTIDQYVEYARLAQSSHMLASCGSDFHSSTESRIDLGALPPMPKNLTPIWKAFTSLIQA